VAAAPATTRLTEASATALAAAIRSGEASAREVVEAHVAVLRDAQPRTGALARERFDLALEEADAADRRIAGGEADLPALLGVPCTVKESIALAGMPNCAGLEARRDHRAQTTAPAAQRLIDAGAIALGVTNTSEMTMWIESVNRVYGRTSNAYDARRTAGGSSGGEGAAVGSGGSPFGLGSDIAGSIRIPAFFNGVFGHMPTNGLIPNTGQFPSAAGEAAKLLTIGPLARRAEDLMPLLRVLAGPDGEDPNTHEATLGDPGDVDLGALDVVIGERGWWIPPARELLDARERAAGALAAGGARVRRESLTSLRRAFELFLAALGDGSPASFAEVLAEAGVPEVVVRRALRETVRGRGHTLPTLILLVAERLGDRQPRFQVRRALAAGRALAEEIEGILGAGVLLHPPHARVAPRHGRTVGRGWAITPTAAFNLLRMPVTEVPLGLNAKGLPLGVQVAGRRDADHVTIACALALERAFGGWVAPPAYRGGRCSPTQSSSCCQRS
jgi:fatty acid amide hydrolase 2